MTLNAANLPGRSLIEVAGEDRIGFLQGLITNDVEGLEEGSARFAGLLSPQGKILFDFFAINTGNAIVLDCPAEIGADLLKRLTLYKLRAKLHVADVTSKWKVAVAWGDEAEALLKTEPGFVFQDPRLPGLGFRALLEDALPDASGDYDGLRATLAIPEGGKDYAYGETFPHEACFDLLGAVNFKKGCYVGQEVVSRMQHRGTARTRVLSVSADQPLPEGGVDILAGGFPVGRIGTVSYQISAIASEVPPHPVPLPKGRGNAVAPSPLGKRAGVRGSSQVPKQKNQQDLPLETRGIALARLDRVREALAKGQKLTAGNIPVTLSVPSWANYSLEPEASGAGH